jgi:hypothetical protein
MVLIIRYKKIKYFYIEAMKPSQLQALHIAEQRAKDLLMQLELIRKVDYIKYRLNGLRCDGSYYDIINDERFSSTIEELFGTSDRPEAISMYKDLIAQRNYLVHPHTSRAWKKDRKKPENFEWVNKRRVAVATLLKAVTKETVLINRRPNI